MELDARGPQKLVPGRHLHRAAPAVEVVDFGGVQIDDPRLASVLAADASLWCLYNGTVHAEGPVWQSTQDRLLFSDVPNRRVLGWYPDGRVEVIIDRTHFINGNALDAQGRVLHCEHGRRCISRSSASDSDGDDPEPLITHYRGRRLNSPNDIVLAPDGAIWFTDPTFGILMPSQGSLEVPELDHRSIYRFDADTHDLSRMADFEQPNGLAFSADGRVLYVSDTSRALGEIPGCVSGTKHEITAFDVSPQGALSNRRFFCQTNQGCPDGFLVDQRGWLWTTAADGIHIWSADRERLGFVPTPVVASNCSLGGRRGRRLFITASSYLLAIDLKD